MPKKTNLKFEMFTPKIKNNITFIKYTFQSMGIIIVQEHINMYNA